MQFNPFSSADFRINRSSGHEISAKRKAIPMSDNEFEPIKGRRVRPLKENLTPSVSMINDLSQAIREHAGLRIEIFNYFAKHIAGIAVRTNGSVTNVKGIVGHAHSQQGHGSLDDDTNAAHCCPFAGYRDNWKSLTINQIVEEEDVTPKKRAYFKAVGALDSDIDDLFQHADDKEYIIKKVQELAPGPSIFSNTYIEEVLNTTTTLPRKVNSHVDCRLEEKLKPLVPDLLLKVMTNQLTVKEARNQFSHLVMKLLEDVYSVNEKQLNFQLALGLDCSEVAEIGNYILLELEGTRQSIHLLNKID